MYNRNCGSLSGRSSGRRKQFVFTGRRLIRRKPVPGWPLFSLPMGLLLLAPPAGLANSPPNTPTITEPSFDGKIVNPQDVHLETGPFSDPDPGDTHLCSD